jgi:Protein of unknown function (DUF3638)
VFENTCFQDELATFLERASTESIKRFAPRTAKAGSNAFESRDSVDPSLITQMLMTLLEVSGHRIFPQRLQKRVRDDVCWTDGAEKPWRRCPYWLVLRVGVERYLCATHGGEAGRVRYKFLLCLVLAGLIKDALGHLSPELLALLNAKLGRRIVKLEVEKGKASANCRSIYSSLFETLGPLLHETIIKAKERIAMDWNGFKKQIRRPIPFLQRRAERNDLILRLPNSGPYVQRILAWHSHVHSAPASSQSFRLPARFDVSAATKTYFNTFATHHYLLSDLEAGMADYDLGPTISSNDQGKRCIELAGEICTYLDAVGNAYDSHPGQKSIMLLTVMGLWTSMDREATNLFGLLLSYNPGIPPEILEVLHVPHITDMYRLQEIEEYLKDRYAKCNSSRRTIFEDPTKGCFAERYFQESQHSEELESLQQSIEACAKAARNAKEEEWQRLSAEYQELETSIAQSTCLYTKEDFRVVHDDSHCTKCYRQRKAKRMRIEIHEHPLPSNPVHAKAVVFELGCPKAFKAYRDATWRILGTLARAKLMHCPEPRMVIREYSALRAFMKVPVGGVSLASTHKPFLSTHYKSVCFPVGLEHVCLESGLRWAYFDTATKLWCGRNTQKPSFAHHCHLTMPESSPFSFLQSSDKLALDLSGPSSYDIIASQTRCPSGLNVQEFMAFQTLLSGKNRRWPQMLIELGSTNLNFSSEATTSLMVQLALQAGPEYNSDPLRRVHRIFRDKSFCERLMEQIDLRLEAISSNWRETSCAQMLLALTLRLCSIGSQSVVREALQLLCKIRATTFQWISRLRTEIYNSTDASTSRRCSRYAFWAALLCKRTFAVQLEGVDDEYIQSLLFSALPMFIECSITLQDNLVGDPATSPMPEKNALIDDLKMVRRIQFMLRQCIQASTSSLEIAISNVWPQAEGEVSRSYASFQFLEPPNEWWIQLTINATRENNQQTIHYHLLEGHLLIDGQPLGRLPAIHREALVLQQLFGEQRLLTYPSPLPGMIYTLAFNMYGHQIHLGFRNEVLIVQACVQGRLLELVPHAAFANESDFDLPATLVENSVHWLDLRTGVLEIRQQPDIWIPKPSNWRVDFNTCMAQRRRSWLVDPHSLLFQRVARIFDHFEYRWRLTIFQPERGNLSVELRRLELSFSVNARGLLQCKQLRSVIDRDQDAGTWYGLNSKLVLRDAVNPRQRSIIVPIGVIKYTRNGFHVTVKVENCGLYGRFIINDLLGRLDCPTEPTLLYTKAQLHAYTSFVVPDPLTKRTGTEEALHCLNSGHCQPWTPLNKVPLGILMSMANLTPRREYYPRELKKMQFVVWDPQLTATIQHDGFRSAVQAICDKSERLSAFALQKTEHLSLPAVADSHLVRRSLSRRRLYQRPHPDCDAQQQTSDLVYDARDRCHLSQARLNVFASASLVRDWPSEMAAIPSLAGILVKWPTIGGYDREFDKLLLSDLLDVQFALEWGSLASLCRKSGPENMHRLIFLFSVMSFREDVDMDVLRILIALAVLESTKALDPPKWPLYSKFRPNQTPSLEYLVDLIKDCRDPYPVDERDIFQSSIGSKLRRKLEAAERAHEKQSESECKALAEYFLDQWPCLEPTIEGFSGTQLVDVPRALAVICPEYLRLYQNIELSYYVERLQPLLDTCCTTSETQSPGVEIAGQEALPTRQRGGELVTMSHALLLKAGPGLSETIHPSMWSNGTMGTSDKNDHNTPYVLQKENVPVHTQKEKFTERPRLVNVKSTALPVPHEIQELKRIIDSFADSQSTVQQQYTRDLMQSLKALAVLRSAPKQGEESILPARLSLEISAARHRVEDCFNQLCMAFERDDPCAKWSKEGGLWPCISPVTLLEQLRSTSTTIFGDSMRESLVTYAVSITVLQRLLRMEDAHLKGDHQRLHEELKNPGHSSWQPLRHPDWLLLEIDANILIRKDQIDVAVATISPASGSNSVLQMNMGQGKFTHLTISIQIVS